MVPISSVSYVTGTKMEKDFVKKIYRVGSDIAIEKINVSLE